MTDTLESGFDALEELDWELGGLDDSERFLLTAAGGVLGVVYDDLDDGPEVDGDDHDAAGDGDEMGRQRIPSRAITVGLTMAGGNDEATAAARKSLELVTNPLPDRHRGIRVLRYRRKGEVAKRIYYRPARGKPLEPTSGEAALKYNHADIVIRLEAPLPYRLSDVLHTVTFAEGETKTITNAGSLTVPLPALWTLEADESVTIEHEDYAGESITFPSFGSVSVRRETGSQRPEIIGLNSYGKCHGPAGVTFPRWPLLRPGDNHITASAACTFSWRDTW